MRNLKLISRLSYILHNLEDIFAVCSHEQSIFVCKNGVIVQFKQIGDDNKTYEHRQIADLNGVTTFDRSTPNPVVEYSLHYEKNELVLCMTNGDILCVTVDGETAEVVGCVDSGIKAAEWSPEQEMLTIVTGNDTVILMSHEFDPIAEVELHSSDYGASQFINVGWGKKETQFHGSEGKAAAKSKPKVLNEISSHDDLKTRISWRNDSEFFAVSSIRPEKGCRYIRIYNKDAVLQYTSEDLRGLESALHWHSSKLIAGTQRLPNKHVICFIEKNGLKHGEFILPYKQDEVNVNRISWNEDSKILLIVCEMFKEPKQTFIHLFTRGNYHWYCKYTIPVSIDEKLVYIAWDKQKSRLLHLLVEKEHKYFYKQFLWTWNVDQSEGRTVEDETVTAVIDGNKLNVTIFSRSVIPPPMCTFTLEAPLTINNVIFSHDSLNICEKYGENCNDLILVLADDSIIFYKYKVVPDTKIIGYEPGPHFTLNYDETSVFNHFVWLCKNTVLCSLNSSDVLKCDSSIAAIYFEDNKCFVKKICDVPCTVQSIVKFKQTNDIFVMCVDGNGYKYSLSVNNNEVTVFESSKIFEGMKSRIYDTQIKKIDDKFHIISLDSSNKLYLDSKVVFNNVTTFLVHDDFILLTTLDNRLLCLRLKTHVIEKLMSGELDAISGRRLERGSRLVSSINNDTRVILQMPRGNLECIQPRDLSLSVIGKLLDEKKYFEAFNIMRRERINLNLIVDHKQELFLSSINDFVAQVQDLSWICLFLSDLSNEDVTKTMYNSIYGDRNVADVSSKTELVCNQMLNVLTNAVNSESYLLPILTCHIKKGKTEDVEAALRKIKEIKEKEVNGEAVAITSDIALKHVIYTIDVEELYKTALGMYDFDLVLLVANKSQKDPKEYLQFLNDLRKLEPGYQQFTIEKYLKRYNKALVHILNYSEKNNIQECLQFIKTHKLYQLALSMVNINDDKYKLIAGFYAEELSSTRSYAEAGIMFVRAGLYEKAMQVYIKSNNWFEVIQCLKKLNYESDKMKLVYRDLVAQLKNVKRYNEAATISIEYLNDLDLGLTVLCSGKNWNEALRIVDKYEKHDYCERYIIPGILDHYSSITEQIIQVNNTIFTQKKRLQIVRENKLKNESLGFDINEESDLYSEASTVKTLSYAGTRSSARTFRSSKNKRKHERKLLSLKEGSPFEDLALIASLHQHVTTLYELQTEVKELLWALILIGKDLEGKNLQDTYCKVLKKVNDCIGEIWTSELLEDKGYGPDATANDIAESFQKGIKSSIAPNIDAYLRIPPKYNKTVKWEFEVLKR